MTEQECLGDGAGYPGIRKFFGKLLPAALDKTDEMAKGETTVKIHIGAELLPYYVSRHLIMNTDLHVEIVLSLATFPLGGTTLYARAHPLLLRRLMTDILTKADAVTTNDPEHHVEIFSRLKQLLPSIVRFTDGFENE